MRAIEAIVADFDGDAEKFDSEDMELSQLADLLLGGTLFADKRLVIIKDLSSNKVLWDGLSGLAERMGSDVHLVLVEPKPDKRTKTYKDLKQSADVKEFVQWSERDSRLAETWVVTEAKRQGFALDKRAAAALVRRVGADQWALYHALEKLAVLDRVDETVIETTVEAQPNENVFNLLDAALRGDTRQVSTMVRNLQRTQDAYMTFGLLSSQVFQLTALAASSKPSGEVASDIGAHPYALGKLAPRAKKLGRTDTRKIIRIFADTDMAMKSTATDPWLLVEKALIKTASV